MKGQRVACMSGRAAWIRVYDPAPMLPRPASLAAAPWPGRPGACRRRRPASASRWPVQPVNTALKRWVQAPGSLTARLRALGTVELAVLSQGTRRLWPAERRAIGQPSGHVREIILSLNGQPVVWARSVTAQRTLKGPWKAIRGLGSRPLAELLFSHAGVQRGPLVRHAWRRHGPEHERARRPWPANQPPPAWARASVFRHHGQPLRVMEAFAPWARSLLTA